MSGSHAVLAGGIGPWSLSDDGRALIRRGDPPSTAWPRQGGSWSTVDHISVRPERTHRVALVGESVARGFLIDPVVNPAGLCRTELRAAGVESDVELLDFGVNNLAPSGALTLCRAAVELGSSVIVVYVGNNFLRSTPWLAQDTRAMLADTLDTEGYAAYLAARESAAAEVARRFRAELTDTCAAAGVRLIVVVPAVNVLDWQSRWVVPTWLPGDRVTEWMAAYRQLSELSDEEDAAQRLALARRLVELDGGCTPRPLEVLGRELVRCGQEDDGFALLDKAMSVGADPAAYDRRCPAAVAGELLQAAEAPGVRLVDVPALLRERFGARAFGKDVFLDYCHHTPESLHVVVHAITGEILASIGHADAVRPEPTVPVAYAAPNELAVSYLLAALHNQHWGQSAGTVRHWIGEALRADPACVDCVTGYFAMSTPETRFWLAPSRLAEKWERIYWFLRNFSEQPVLDRAFAARCLQRSEDLPAVHAGLRAELEGIWRPLGVEELREVDLLDPFWRDRDGPPQPAAVYTGEKGLVGRYGFIATGDVDLRLDVVVTLGPGLRPGDLVIRLNGHTCATATVPSGWLMQTVTLPSALLNRGANELVMSWPATSREPGTVRSMIRELGIGPENLDLVRIARLRVRAD